MGRKRKRKSRPTSKARGKKQKLRERYSRAREDAQLAGIIDTTPEGALKPERVDPATQSEQQFPRLENRALRGSWAVPDDIKPVIIERLSEPFLEPPQVVVGDKGNRRVIPPDRHLLKENAKVLLMADKLQREIDNPAKPQVNINATQNNVTINWDAHDAQRLEVGAGVIEIAEAELEALELEAGSQVAISDPVDETTIDTDEPDARRNGDGH